MSTKKKPIARAKPLTRKTKYRKPPSASNPPKRGTRAPKDDNTFLGIEKPNSLGANIGSFVGHGAQQLIKYLTGFGDYHIDKNSIIEGGMSPPQMVNSLNRGGFIVRHREYVADITASTSFVNQTFDINPGLSGSFPYLSQIAKAFELYRLRGLVYEFKSMSSDSVLSSGASTALGTVAMATQYNSLNPGFTNLIAMENHEFSSACKPSCDMYHPVECKKSLLPASELYTRTGAVPAGADIRLFDLGQFNIATSGMQNATGVIGQLWCTYEIEFYQAKYDAPSSILTDKWKLTGADNTAWLGTAKTAVPGSSLGLSFTTNVLTFPKTVRDGKYFFHMKIVPVGGSAAWVIPSITSVNCSFETVFCSALGFDDNSASGSANMTGIVYVLGAWVKIDGPSATLTFAGGTLATSNVDLIMTQVDSNIGS